MHVTTCFRSLTRKDHEQSHCLTQKYLDVAVALGLLLIVVLPVPVRAAFVSASVSSKHLALVVLPDTSGVVWSRCVLASLPPLQFAVYSAGDIGQPHDSSNDTVCNLALFRVPRQLQAKSTVDNTESDDDTSQPQVTVTPKNAAGVLLEHDVVEETEEWLEEEQHKDDDSDNWMDVVESTDLFGHVDTDTEGDDEEEVTDDLACGVDPDEAAEGSDADQDTAYWEEDDKGERSEDTVGGHELCGVFSVTAKGNVGGVEASTLAARGARVASVASIV